MNTSEFSNNFDVLLNSFNDGTSNISISLDEYEKSLFLTLAQEEVVINAYNGKLTSESFESTEEMRRYLSSLVRTSEITSYTQAGLTNMSRQYSLPNDVLFITYEVAKLTDESLGCKNNSIASINPITQDELYNTLLNPFKTPSYNKVLRLDIQYNKVELISKYNIEKYIVRYLSKPSPIILVDLSDDLSIDNKNTRTECSLDSSLHRFILNRAVQLAIASRANSAR